MIVPMKKRTLPWENAAIRRIGVPMIAPTRPIPWLIPFATSSAVDCVQIRNGSDSSVAFIHAIMQCMLRGFCQIKNRDVLARLDANVEGLLSRNCVGSLCAKRLHRSDQSDLF